MIVELALLFNIPWYYTALYYNMSRSTVTYRTFDLPYHNYPPSNRFLTKIMFFLGENETKNQNVKEIDECVHKITADIVHRVQMMKTRHMKQLRKLNEKSWFKKSKVRPLNVGQSNEVSIEDIT